MVSPHGLNTSASGSDEAGCLVTAASGDASTYIKSEILVPLLWSLDFPTLGPEQRWNTDLKEDVLRAATGHEAAVPFFGVIVSSEIGIRPGFGFATLIRRFLGR